MSQEHKRASLVCKIESRPVIILSRTEKAENTVEVWTKGGLVTYYLLFVMKLKSRRVHFAGCTTNPHEAWMKQMARELTNHEDGSLQGKRYLIMDRDSKFSESFRAFLSKDGVEPMLISRFFAFA
jgi:hypothetical protein